MQRSYRMLEEVTVTGASDSVGVKSKSGVMLQVIGSSIAGMTLVPEGSIYDGDWDGLACKNMSDFATIDASTGITAAGTYWVPTPNLRAFRVNVSALSSGTVTVHAGVGDADGPPSS